MALITCKEITDYIAYCNKHKKWINEDRRLLIDNIVKPMLKRKDLFFDKEMYELCIRYCESNYYPLFPYQKFIYAMVFIYTDEDKLFPMFRKFIVLEGRGNGKDGFIAPLANFLQTPMHGVDMYHIDIVANCESQAEDTFKVVYRMLESNRSKFKGKFTVTKELIVNNKTHSELRFNTSNADTKDGKQIGMIVFNELHAYKDNSQINVFESAQGKVREARVFVITTQGYVRDGPLDETLGVCREILRSGDNQLGYFPFLCAIDDESDVDNREAWHKSNPSLEYMKILAHQIELDYIEMKKFPSKRAEFMTKRMDFPAIKQEDTITDWNNILACCYDDIKLRTPRATQNTEGQPAVVGIDYADIQDFASVGVLTKADNGEFIWRQHTWINARSKKFEQIKFPIANIGQKEFQDFEVIDAPTIPIDAMVDYIDKNYATKYDVKKIAMDTYRYTLFKIEFSQRGFTIESKDNPTGVVRLIRKLGAATGIIAPFIELCFADHKINFGSSAIMRWYTNNVSVITDKFGNKQFGKIEPVLRKTDGFMAFDVAMFCKEELEQPVFYV